MPDRSPSEKPLLKSGFFVYVIFNNDLPSRYNFAIFCYTDTLNVIELLPLKVLTLFSADIL